MPPKETAEFPTQPLIQEFETRLHFRESEIAQVVSHSRSPTRQSLLDIYTGFPYICLMRSAPDGFEWDERKAEAKLDQGVDFHETVEAFQDLDSVEFLDDREDYGEERWVVIGATASGRLLTVVYTERQEKIRIITAWNSTRAEEAKYHEPDTI